jgi:glycosyltransferase involved in cell wall biosynthesis
MAPNRPRVSVIVPVFEGGELLDEALASVRAQSFTDYELLLVDDGSREPATLAALERAERGGARVERRAHAGVTHARNHGLACSSGDYVCFFDADDRMGPRLLERTVARLDADDGLAFASFWIRLFGDESWLWQPEACDLRALLLECTVATAAVARRAAVEAVGGFDPAMESGHEDWDLWLGIVAQGGRGEIVREVLFEYRRHAGSRSAQADADPGYLSLLGARMRKHAAAYAAHLPELLLVRDRDLCERLDRIRAGREAAG